MKKTAIRIMYELLLDNTDTYLHASDIKYLTKIKPGCCARYINKLYRLGLISRIGLSKNNKRYKIQVTDWEEWKRLSQKADKASKEKKNAVQNT